MSILNLSSLRKMFNTSSKKGSGKKSISEKMNRKLALDSLEARVLLSVTPNTTSELLVNTEYSTNQSTYTNGNAISVDDDGDYVVTWTRGDNIYKDTTYGNVGWYNEEGELVFYTDRNFIDGYYIDDNGEMQDVTLEPYQDRTAGVTMQTYYVDQFGNEGWDRNHSYTNTEYAYRKYSIYTYEIDGILHRDYVTYQEGDNFYYVVKSGQYYTTGEMTADGKRELANPVRLSQRERAVSRQLVDYNVYGRYFTDEVQRVIIDTSNLGKSTGAGDGEMLYKAQLQVGEWYEQSITFSRSYDKPGSYQDPIDVDYELTFGEETANFHFSETDNSLQNAKNIQDALNGIFGQGNVIVTPETSLKYNIKYKTDAAATSGSFIDSEIVFQVKCDDPDSAFGAAVEFVSRPHTYEFYIEYAKVYNSRGVWTGEYEKELDDEGNWTGRYVVDLGVTASEIEMAFAHGNNTQGSISDSWSNYASPDDAAPATGIRYETMATYEVNVVPVYGLDENNDKIGFDITFVYKSGKQDVPEIKVNSITTIKEEYYSEDFADTITADTSIPQRDLVIYQNEMGFIEGIPEFRDEAEERIEEGKDTIAQVNDYEAQYEETVDKIIEAQNFEATVDKVNMVRKVEEQVELVSEIEDEIAVLDDELAVIEVVQRLEDAADLIDVIKADEQDAAETENDYNEFLGEALAGIQAFEDFCDQVEGYTDDDMSVVSEDAQKKVYRVIDTQIYKTVYQNNRVFYENRANGYTYLNNEAEKTKEFNLNWQNVSKSYIYYRDTDKNIDQKVYTDNVKNRTITLDYVQNTNAYTDKDASKTFQFNGNNNTTVYTNIISNVKITETPDQKIYQSSDYYVTIKETGNPDELQYVINNFPVLVSTSGNVTTYQIEGETAVLTITAEGEKTFTDADTGAEIEIETINSITKVYNDITNDLKVTIGSDRGHTVYTLEDGTMVLTRNPDAGTGTFTDEDRGLHFYITESAIPGGKIERNFRNLDDNVTLSTTIVDPGENKVYEIKKDNITFTVTDFDNYFEYEAENEEDSFFVTIEDEGTYKCYTIENYDSSTDMIYVTETDDEIVYETQLIGVSLTVDKATGNMVYENTNHGIEFTITPDGNNKIYHDEIDGLTFVVTENPGNTIYRVDGENVSVVIKNTDENKIYIDNNASVRVTHLGDITVYDFLDGNVVLYSIVVEGSGANAIYTYLKDVKRITFDDNTYNSFMYEVRRHSEDTHTGGDDEDDVVIRFHVEISGDVTTYTDELRDIVITVDEANGTTTYEGDFQIVEDTINGILTYTNNSGFQATIDLNTQSTTYQNDGRQYVMNEVSNDSEVITLKECSKEFRVNPTSDELFNRKSKILTNTDQYESAVALDDNGDFAVTWTSDTLFSFLQGSFTDVYVKLYSASMVNTYDAASKSYIEINDGKAVKARSGALMVNPKTTNPQQATSIAMDDAGNIFVVWSEIAQTLSYENGIYMSCLDRQGNLIDLRERGIDGNITVDGLAVRIDAEATGHSIMPQVAASPDGKMVAVSWNHVNPTQPAEGGIFMTVFTIETDENRKTTMAKVVDSSPVDTGRNIAYDSAYDSLHMTPGWFYHNEDLYGDEGFRRYSYDNNTSIQINKAGDINIAWTAIGQDPFGMPTTDTYFSQFRLEDGALTIYRDKYRINSASMDSTTDTTWSWNHQNPSVASDADGDFIVSYDGAGQDFSESVRLNGAIIQLLQRKINITQNADLLPFINWNYIQQYSSYSDPDNPMSSFSWVDTAIEDICAHALKGQFSDPYSRNYEYYSAYDDNGNPANGYYENARMYQVVTEDGTIYSGYRMAESTDTNTVSVDYNYEDAIDVSAPAHIHKVYPSGQNYLKVDVLRDGEIVKLTRIASLSDDGTSKTYTEYRNITADAGGPAVVRENGTDKLVCVLDEAGNEVLLPQVIYPKTVVTKTKEPGQNGAQATEVETTTYDYTFTESLNHKNSVEITSGTVFVKGYGRNVTYTVLENGFVVERVRVAVESDTDKNVGYDYSERVTIRDAESGFTYSGYKDADGNPVRVLVVNSEGVEEYLPLVAKFSDRSYHPNYAWNERVQIGVAPDGSALYGYKDADGNIVTMTIMYPDQDATGVTVYQQITGLRVANQADTQTSDSQYDFRDSTPLYTGCSQEQYARLYAILHSVLDLTKGENNGVMYSAYDTSATGETPSILSGDVIVNTVRDGEDAKYYITMDRSSFFSANNNEGRRINGLTYASKYLTDDNGNFVFDTAGRLIEKEAVNDDDFDTYSFDEIVHRTLRFNLIWGADTPDYLADDQGYLEVTRPVPQNNRITVEVDLVGTMYNWDGDEIPPAYVNGNAEVNIGAIRYRIEHAIEEALMANYENDLLRPENQGFQGAVSVSFVSTGGARLLDDTVYDISSDDGDTYDTYSADRMVFEVQFQGQLHDTPVALTPFQIGASDDFVYRNSYMVDLNHAEGWYARFNVNGELQEDVILDFSGITTVEGKYRSFEAQLRDAIRAAGANVNLLDFNLVDMVCDVDNSPYYEYGQVYQVLVINELMGVDPDDEVITFSLNTSNPDADNNNNNNNNNNQEENVPKYPDWDAHRLEGDIIGAYRGRNRGTLGSAYMEGSAGTSQAFSNVGMTPEGDFAFTWTQYNQDSTGNLMSQSIYTRTYNEIYDTYGPRVSDVYFSNKVGIQLIKHGSTDIQPGATVEDLSTSDQTSALIVTFTEDMMDYLKLDNRMGGNLMDVCEAHSVTNLDNWVLIKDGVILNNAIKEIYFGMNASADPYIQNMGTITALCENKWEAVVILNNDVDLTTGNYEIQLNHEIQDADGRLLNTDGIDTEGSNTSIVFDILTGAQPVEDETPEDEYDGDQMFVDLDNVSDIWSPTALACDPEGDSVIVWTSNEAGKEGVYAKVRYLKWDEAISANRENCALDISKKDDDPDKNRYEGEYVLQVTNDPTAYGASVDMSGDGNFVVTWTAKANDSDKENRGTYVYARVYDLNGKAITDAFVVSQTQAESRWSQVAVSEYGDFVITWQTYNRTDGWDIFALRYDEYGKILGTVDEVQTVNFSRDFNGSFQIRVTDPNTYKMYVTEWIDSQSSYTIYRDIQKALDALEIPGLTFVVTAKSRTQVSVRIICDNSITNPNVELLEILASKDTKGTVTVSSLIDGSRAPFMVNQTTEGNQIHPAIDMDYDGNFVISWTSNVPGSDDAWDTDIYARLFSSSKELGLLDSSVKTEETTNLGNRTGKITWVDDADEPLSTQSGVAHIEVDDGHGGGWSGSGVLLSDGNCTYVLTAQHCVNSDGIISNTGNTTIEFYNTSGNKVTAQVEEVYLYPGYNPTTQYGDIALIKLKSSLSGSVTGFGINREQGIEKGAIYTRYGFGTYGKGSEGNVHDVDGTMHTGQNRWEYISNDGMLWFDFDDGTTENNTLAEGISQYFGATITSDLGVGSKETDSCGGDSGGPCLITVDGETLVAGICAGGTTDECKYGDISYDTQVSYYANWIDSIIGVSDGASSGEFVVNTTKDGMQKWSDVALDADGDFVITWTSTISESNTETDVYARRYNKDGSAFSDNDFKVNTYTERQQQLSKVAMDADGDFVITWESYQEYNDGAAVGEANNYGIYMQRFASNDKMTNHASLYGINGESGTEMRVNDTMYGNQRIPAVDTTATGDIFFAWQSDETIKDNYTGSENIYSRNIYKSYDDAGPVVVRLSGEYTPTVIGPNGELIDSGRDPILDEDGNEMYVYFLIEDGRTYLQNSDYQFIDRDGNLVNEAMTVLKNGYIVGTDVKAEMSLVNGKLYLKNGSTYYNLDGTTCTNADPYAVELLRNGKLVDSHGHVTDISPNVILENGKVFILTKPEKKYYDANGTESSTPQVADRLVEIVVKDGKQVMYLLDKSGNRVLVEEQPVEVARCWITDGVAYIKNGNGYYLDREGQAVSTKKPVETYTSDGKIIINDKPSDISATVRYEDGKVYFEHITSEMLDRDGVVKERVGVDSLVNISSLGDSPVIYGKINDGLYITFDEQLWGQKDDLDEGGVINERRQNSILNNSNITIKLNGVNITTQVLDHIELANDLRGIGYDNIDENYTGSKDHHSEKDIYKIVFREGVALETGVYQVIIDDNVEDRFGNHLDGDKDGVPGGDAVLTFEVVAGFDDIESVSYIDDEENTYDEPVNSFDDIINGTYANYSLDPAVATNKWGDYVVVWVTEVRKVGDEIIDPEDDNDDDEPWVPQTVIMGQRYLRDNTKLGDEFCISEYTTTVEIDDNGTRKTILLDGYQQTPAVAMDDNGNFVVTWTVNARDLDNDGRISGDEESEYDVFARTYNMYGEATSVPFLVDDDAYYFRNEWDNYGCSEPRDYSTPGKQMDSAVAYYSDTGSNSSNDDGFFVITWTTLATKYDADANPDAYWARLRDINDNVLTDSNGNVQNDLNGVYMARFKVGENVVDDKDYAPIYRQKTPQLVNDHDVYAQGKSTVAVNGEGDIYVAWQYDNTKTGYDIYLRKFEKVREYSGKYLAQYVPASDDLGQQMRVNNKNTRLNQVNPDIAVNDQGDFVIAWSSQYYDSGTEVNMGTYDIVFRTYDTHREGTARWSDEQRANMVEVFDQTSPTVAITRYTQTEARNEEDHTGFSIAWTSYGQEGLPTRDLGVYLISYIDITRRYENNQVYGWDESDSNVRKRKDGVEKLVNAYRPGDEKNPDMAMSCYGDIIIVWEGPSIARIQDPIHNMDEVIMWISQYTGYTPAYLRNRFTNEELLAIFNDCYGTSIYKDFIQGFPSTMSDNVINSILEKDGYTPLVPLEEVPGGPGSAPNSTGIMKSGPTVSVDSEKTTIYTEKNTASDVVINLTNNGPVMTINGNAVDLSTETDAFVFNGYYAGNAVVNVAIRGAGGEEVDVENGIMTIKANGYSFIVRNVNTAVFNSQDVDLTVNARRNSNFVVEGSNAYLSESAACYSVIGCKDITAIGQSSAIAKLTGTEDEDEFQVKANEITMTGRVNVSVQGFGKVALNGAAQDEVFFTNMGDFTVNESVISVTGVEASNFANVHVTTASTGVGNVTTGGAATVNVSGKTLTIAGNGFTQTYTGMSTLNLTGTKNASVEVSGSSSVTYGNGTLTAAKYTVNAFGQVMVNASTVTLNGSEGDDMLTIDASTATFESAGYEATFNNVNTLTLNDSEGNDAVSVLTNIDHASITIQNGVAKIGKYITLKGVSTLAIACANANATANISGSLGDDVFNLSEGTVSANIEGASYTVTGASTITVNGYEGNDVLIADDTAGDDTFTLAPSSLRASGNGYTWTVNSVENIKLYQSNGGNDTLTVKGSSAIDNAVVSPQFASVMNANKETVSAYGFRNIQVKNVEYIAMYDSEGDDVLSIYNSTNGQASLESAGSFFNQISGFRKLSVFSSGDGDDTINAEIQAVDEIFSAPNNSWSIELNGFNF